MTTDLYTKTLLTVIAACLVYLCLARPDILPRVSAQAEPTRVVIAGWTLSPNGNVNHLGGQPLPVTTGQR